MFTLPLRLMQIVFVICHNKIAKLIKAIDKPSTALNTYYYFQITKCLAVVLLQLLHLYLVADFLPKSLLPHLGQ